MDVNVSKAVELLEVHQLKKLVERAKAGQELSRSDLQLLHRLSEKLDAAKAQSEAQKPLQKMKRKRGRPTNPRVLADRITHQALEDLSRRQERGDKLSGADYAFLEKMTHAEKATGSNVIQMPLNKETRAQRLARLDEDALRVIENGLRTERGVALATFAKMAREAAAAVIVAEKEIVRIQFEPIEFDKEETA